MLTGAIKCFFPLRWGVASRHNVIWDLDVNAGRGIKISASGLGNDRRSDGDEFGELFPSGVERTIPPQMC